MVAPKECWMADWKVSPRVVRLGGYWANWTAARTANGWAERLAAMTALPKVSHLAYQTADHLAQQRAA